MQTRFNIHEAKTRLSQLIEQVEAGGEVVIVRAGKPAVRLVRVQDQQTPRVLGKLAGRYALPAGVHQPVPETPADFSNDLTGH